MEKQFDLKTSEGFIQAFGQFNFLKEKGATIELKEIKPTRSNQQNKAIHLYFTLVSDSLNDSGLYFRNMDLFGLPVEKQWSPELVKEFIWKPIQKTLFDIDSTTKLKTAEINTILDVLANHFAKVGITVHFPTQFDLWLKTVKL